MRECILKGYARIAGNYRVPDLKRKKLVVQTFIHVYAQKHTYFPSCFKKCLRCVYLYIYTYIHFSESVVPR